MASTWVTPVTNRTDGTWRMTYIDMNRITGNLDYLFNVLPGKGFRPAGETVKKTSWTQNDIITIDDWADILSVLGALAAAVSYTPDQDPDTMMSWDNINNVESITWEIYKTGAYSPETKNINHWIGDLIFAGDPVNAGGDYTS